MWEHHRYLMPSLPNYDERRKTCFPNEISVFGWDMNSNGSTWPSSVRGLLAFQRGLFFCKWWSQTKREEKVRLHFVVADVAGLKLDSRLSFPVTESDPGVSTRWPGIYQPPPPRSVWVTSATPRSALIPPTYLPKVSREPTYLPKVSPDPTYLPKVSPDPTNLPEVSREPTYLPKVIRGPT